MKLSIIIPCYNEEKTITEIISKINSVTDLNKEIIVIDDNSNDKTKSILENNLINQIDHLIFNKQNYGKGYSIREGVKRATGDCVIIQDADLEYDPLDYFKLIDPIKKGYADVVYGSRFLGGTERRVLYFWHTVGNKLLTLLSNLLTNLNLSDMEVGYKVFKRSVLKSINLQENRFGFEPEITAKIAKMKNVRIFEVSVSYNGRTYEEGKKITWKDGFSALRCIIKYNLMTRR